MFILAHNKYQLRHARRIHARDEIYSLCRISLHTPFLNKLDHASSTNKEIFTNCKRTDYSIVTTNKSTMSMFIKTF